MRDIIVPEKYRPARFYCLVKVHKGLENPPGRPIMSGNNHTTERLSEYVDREINPFVPSIPSHIKDTNHLIDILKDLNLPKEAILTSFDVTGLYTNIPHIEGIEAIKQFMTEKPTHGKEK